MLCLTQGSLSLSVQWHQSCFEFSISFFKTLLLSFCIVFFLQRLFPPLIIIKFNNLVPVLSPFLAPVNLISFWACIFKSFIPSSILPPYSCFSVFFNLTHDTWGQMWFQTFPSLPLKKSYCCFVMGTMNLKSLFLCFICPQKWWGEKPIWSSTTSGWMQLTIQNTHGWQWERWHRQLNVFWFLFYGWLHEGQMFFILPKTIQICELEVNSYTVITSYKISTLSIWLF